MPFEESVMESDGWSSWTEIADSFSLTPRVLEELLWGGQTFQWFPLDEKREVWDGLLNSLRIQLRSNAGNVEFRVLLKTSELEEARSALKHFFRLDENLEELMSSFPLAKDDYLSKCVNAFPGLRILRQPIEKVLLTFLCSSNKHIDQIRKMLGMIAHRFGEAITDGWHEYPTWQELAKVAVEELSKCSVGYRGKYIVGSAQRIAQEPEFFEKLERLPFEEAKMKLIELPGVGEKVADCVLLYGGGHYEAFPFDTWILKAVSQRYGLEGKSRKEMQRFVEEHLGDNRGIAQQYIFAYEREVREL